MTLRSAFVSPDATRLRAGWRIALFLVAFVALNLVVQTVFKALNGGIRVRVRRERAGRGERRRGHARRPGWLSGGAFGPEGSVLILPVLAAALAAMRWWAGRTDRPEAIPLGAEARPEAVAA